jgi:DNA processing protein
MNEEQRSLFRLHMSPGFGRTTLFKLKNTFGSFHAALISPPADLIQKAGLSPRQAGAILARNDPALIKGAAALDEHAVKLISFWDETYPACLRHIHDPPALLYLRGTLPNQESLAVVGSRRATATGLQLTYEISAELARRGITVVSGLARGIDTAAHRGALSVAGSTVAALIGSIRRKMPDFSRKSWKKMPLFPNSPREFSRYPDTSPAAIASSADSPAASWSSKRPTAAAR